MYSKNDEVLRRNFASLENNLFIGKAFGSRGICCRIFWMSYKKEQKKDNEPLTCVIVADSYDARFAPLLTTCLQTICNVPLIYYTLSWIMRTEIRKVLLVVSEKNSDLLKKVERSWSHCFESFSVISCKDANSVGDALRELDSRGLLTGDFLLLSNPATFTSATLQAQIAAFRCRRIENKNNVMTLIYSDLKTAKNAVIGIEASKAKFARKPDFISNTVIRRDILDSGVALCSLNIAAQFSDNFDFQHRDDVIRDILVNEEILLQNIHVEILDPFEAAFFPNFLVHLMRCYSGPNSLLVNCIIGEKCVIGADCRIVDAVLGNGIRIPDGTNLQKQSIISSEVCHESLIIMMHNLILEINSSKLAYNISMEDVAKYVFFAFLCLPGNDSWIKLKELCQKWILLLQNYYKPKKSQIQLLLAIEVNVNVCNQLFVYYL
uniref:Translation initiation factor eIF2B subunit epsilon n=1 Tax=Angiostrongylus cantonensis TaxID=6313 RepID=A0A0K0DJ22_ANGCA